MSSACPGCSQLFSASGLSMHLAQTRKPECIAARDAAHRSRRGDAIPAPSLPPFVPEDFDLDADPIPFEGDYFGSYADGDFDDLADERSDSSSSSDDEENLEAEVETASWEPPPRSLTAAASDLAQAMDDTGASNQHSPSQAERRAAEETLRHQKKTFVVPFPISTAGAPIPPAECSAETHERVTYEHYQQHVDGTTRNPYAPFASRRDWEIARWAKMRGAGSTAFTDLLTIEGVAKLLQLSFKTARQLNEISDKKLPGGRPRFQREEIIVAGEAFEVFFRNILEFIRALYGDPEFAPLLLRLVPEKHYKADWKM